MQGNAMRFAAGSYGLDEMTLVKVKNPAYSQAEGRAEFFDLSGGCTSKSAFRTALLSCFTSKKVYM